MADLDDFFAKKDRKKKTASKKFSTTEEVAKKLEDTAAKKTEKQKKERAPEGDENNAQAHEQDEWKEFEEEKKDYTGLKIGNLTINTNQENSSVNQEAGSGDQPEGSEAGLETDRKAGPWKRIDVQQQAEVVQEEAPRPAPPVVEKKPEPAPSGGKAYRPPSMRFQSAAPQSSAQPTRLRGQRGAAPDIHNEEFFPTLSKSSDNKKNRNEGSFEVVQQHRASSTYRQQMEQSKGAGGPRLNLGNRYNTLSSNDS